MEPITHDRLAGVSAFVASAEAGSFARAAERLGLTRSAVGKAVARLEERLGTRLFVRTTRSLGLTEDGQMFYERCAQALEDLDAAQHMLEAGRREVVGRLRISAPVVFGRHHVAPLLLDLARHHPRLRIEASFTDRQLDFADDGIDLAIRSGELPDSDWLVARRLGMQAMVLCAAPAYLQARGSPDGLASLAAHRCIAYMRGGRPAPWLLVGADGMPGMPVLEPALGFDDIETIAMAALQGAGVAHMPLWRVRDALDSGALVRLLPEVRSAAIPLHVLWPRTRFLPYRLRVTIDALLETIPPLLQDQGRGN
ncbi:D-malate degradation protein R [Delftia tsuruhatensis]|uniref:LysR family transcriptional regulator n=1 Tax=Delftia tsuruhatensis TaxID=180282 RepID=UPI001E7DE37F|nr:LysR family transcriptional regulator [Delftia tsuruhatensis]CAB5718832.1 D-malate degradation protein R [Delftia tsuruhatensis]CAC9676174.1 D-malate degradation protein R [Delftia tsuruhatensis]